MGVVLVYDWDYFHYSHVIPNLECAKLVAWNRNHRNITVFTDRFEPERYTQSYFRKEYDDGIYDESIINPKVLYGGRAFSDTYKSLSEDIENTVPDFSIYEKYSDLYGSAPIDKTQIKTILYATHFRASTDGINLNPFPFDQLRSNHPCVVFHDYNLASIDGIHDYLYEICAARPKGRPYGIGNKYPIQIYDFKELIKWLDITPMANLFFLQYNGVFTDEELIELTENHGFEMRQIFYNYTYNCRDETEFMMQVLPKIYKQALFLRRSGLKVLLNIDTEFFKTKELIDLMQLINSYYTNKNINKNSPRCQTLYAYCKSERREKFRTLPFVAPSKISKDEMRNSFQYIREHNYEVFDMFYSVPGIVNRGGKLVNEWE